MTSMTGDHKKSLPLVKKVFRFYYEGFRNMSSWGKKVWIIIIIKLFIIFAILKVFFFQDFLQKKYNNDAQRSEYVIDQLTNTSGTDD